MNSEMNNGTNNQNYTDNGQNVNNMVNNQPMNNGLNTGNGQMNMMNNGTNNQNYTNNGQAMNMNNQSMGVMPSGQQPMMNNQNFNGNFMSNSNQKDNKTLFIVIGVAILVVIAVIVLVVVINGNKSKGNTIHDFDNNGSSIQDEKDDDNYADSDTIVYNGLSIPKQKGYQYKIESSSLIISNNSFFTSVSVVAVDSANFESIGKQSIEKVQSSGNGAANPKSASYNGRQVFSFEFDMVQEGYKGLWYLMDIGNGYAFNGMTVNKDGVIDYKNIETSVSLLENAKYTGEYKTPTTGTGEIKFIAPSDIFK